jgi:hypothetical protein
VHKGPDRAESRPRIRLDAAAHEVVSSWPLNAQHLDSTNVSQLKVAQWEKLNALVLGSVSSPITKRGYDMALNEFMTLFQQRPRLGFSKGTMSG